MGFKSAEEMGTHIDSMMNASEGVLREDGTRFWVDYANSAIIFRGPNPGVPGSFLSARQLRLNSRKEHETIGGGPVIARFRRDGVELDLDKSEYIFVYLTLSYVMDGVALADHDFRNILGMTREDAEAFRNGLVGAERVARRQGEHWNPNVPRTE
ncbi:hypothetical protein J7E25_10675 [Agromyces sp. ISL-38]|uniref:hypothetical protein n=1 Tax=Agromyces sp. ISL-38 TaxID=2819107 RepID=UPI001BE74393|nr:hypothetical protein [Agromyces sp. ISL-38]MBT2499562.1 hypothetical protein [Agromyces sp. ISL-38]